MTVLDTIRYVYRFDIPLEQWERKSGADHFIAYKLFGQTVHETEQGDFVFKKDMVMIAHRDDGYRVTRNERAPGGCIAVHFSGQMDRHLTFFDASDRPQIRDGFFSLLDAWERYSAARTEGGYYECVACFYSLLARLSQPNDSSGTPAEQARAFLLRNFANPALSLSDAAAAVSLSPRRMSELFSERFGVTPGAFLRSLRLSNAERLLRETSLSVGEIASRCGYTGENYMIRVFGREKGQTPEKYRKNAGKAAE